MKGNLMVRMMTVMVILAVVLAHINGQTNLLALNWLWLALFASAMGLQATYTGFCPSNLLGKLSKTGECCPSGSCSTQKPAAQTATHASTPTAPQKANDASGCCGGSSSESTCCDDQTSGSQAKDNAAKTGCGNACSSSLTIKVLGTGCANCTNTVKLIQATANELNIAVNIEKIEDIAQIASYGVMSTPAVVINDQMVHSGGIPSKSMITGWLLP